jgi:membrane protease YdiL (CAAX protease family)
VNVKGVAAFLVLAFAIAWGLWELPARFGLPAEYLPMAVLAGTFAPAIAALVVRRFVTREGFADAGLAFHAEKWPYYAAGLVIPLFAVALVALVAPALGLGTPDYSLALGKPMSLASAVAPGATNALIVAMQLSLLSVLLTPVLWGEEFGWRSYLQLRLFGSRPLVAAIATGIIWGVWHFPLLRGIRNCRCIRY